MNGTPDWRPGFLGKQSRAKNMPMASTTTKVCCRPVCPSDLVVVATMFASPYASLTDEISRAEERLGDERRQIVVATKDDIAIGAFYFEIIEADNRILLYFEQVVVAREHRRQGACSAMIEWIGKFADPFNYELAYLQVNRENNGAVDCYLKNGFHIRDSRKDITIDKNASIIRMERAPARDWNMDVAQSAIKEHR
jgi:ribosomal protein S18 acetylase RimI-like enzyme